MRARRGQVDYSLMLESLNDREWNRPQPVWILLWLLVGLLSFSVCSDLWKLWQSDASLSHAPLIPIITLVHLWIKRKDLTLWTSASLPGLLVLVIAVFSYLLAGWAEIEFLKPLGLIGMLIGVFWFLGGLRTLYAALGSLGFLMFLIPWPTTLIGRLQFPMQITSSAYAAMFSGIIGIPVHREGVYLYVIPDPSRPPVYSILVAQACSGLTSLTVLLALGYLIAYHTPLNWGCRALLFFITVPIALFCNALRLTIVLAAGTYHGAAVAQWVHDHEQPVLVFLCTIGLMLFRFALLKWQNRLNPADQDISTSNHAEEIEPPTRDLQIVENRVEQAIISAKPADETEQKPSPNSRISSHWRFAAAISLLTVGLIGGFWGRHAESSPAGKSNFLAHLALPFKDWKQSDLALSVEEIGMLEPDGALLRQYQSGKGASIELAVIAGHRKKTVHTPDYCLAGGGWETLMQRDVMIKIGGKQVPAVRALMLRDNKQVVATYFFTDGEYCTRSLLQFQGAQIVKRLRSRGSLGALIRIMAPVSGTASEAEELTNDFAETTLPDLFKKLVIIRDGSNS